MTTEFLSKDYEKAFEQVRADLYDRLKEVRRTLAVKVDQDDDFNLGIDCAKTNEAEWLEDLLDKIERS
jgi:hypothetical protein